MATLPEDLARSAEAAGIARNDTFEWLKKDPAGHRVDWEVGGAYVRGFKGVPIFIINDKFEVDGAADVSEFLGYFVQAKDDVGASWVYRHVILALLADAQMVPVRRKLNTKKQRILWYCEFQALSLEYRRIDSSTSSSHIHQTS